MLELSEISPVPPRRTAKALFAWLPAVRNTISLLTTGDGIAWLSTPLHRHISLPVCGSYEMTVSAPLTTSSVRFGRVIRSGVAHVARVVLGTLQTSLPVFLSRAAMNEPWPTSWSQTTITRSLTRDGDAPGPIPS